MLSSVPRVLVVDDDPVTVAMIAGALAKEDFDISEAADGMAAIARLETEEFAAVVLDLLMPGMDGFEVLAHLSQRFPDLRERVIVVTALSEEEAGDKIGGVFKVLHKPIDRALLVQSVRAALRVEVL
jgi:CheY-like chemotaxis protein